jgi:hypothetical protein
VQKFAAFVTFLREGWHLLWVGLPAAGLWYLLNPEAMFRVIYSHYLEIWILKHHRSEDAINQYIGEAMFFGLGIGLLSSFLVFLVWVLYTRRIDMEFTRSSVGALAIGCLLVGFCSVIGWLAAVPWFVCMALGATLLFLETRRMRVLAATY